MSLRQADCSPARQTIAPTRLLRRTRLPVATPRGDTEPVPRTLQDLADRVPGSLAEALDRLIESVEKGEDVDVDTLVDVGAVALRVNGHTESVQRFVEFVLDRAEREGPRVLPQPTDDGDTADELFPGADNAEVREYWRRTDPNYRPPRARARVQRDAAILAVLRLDPTWYDGGSRRDSSRTLGTRQRVANCGPARSSTASRSSPCTRASSSTRTGRP